MPFPTPGARMRLLLVVLLLALAWALAAPAAHAGSFQVRACDATGVNRAFVPAGDTAMVAVNGSCLADPVLGMKVRNSLAAPGTLPTVAPGWVAGALVAWAAPGTVITALHADATATGEPGASSTEGWRAGIRADGQSVWCAGKEACSWVGPPALPVHLPLEARAVDIVAYCGLATGCRRDRVRASATLRGVVLDVRDDVAPTIDPRGALWGAGGWVAGTSAVGLGAADGAGVRRVAVDVGGQRFGELENACDFYQMAPCPPHTLLDVPVDTRRLADGRHEVVLHATDAGGNPSTRRSTVQVDNTAPTVGTPELVGGTGWRAENRFELRIDAADAAGGSGVQRVAWEVCRVDGSDCTTSTAAPVSTLSVKVPGNGQWKARAWASDALRWGSKSGWSETLRYDPVEPGQASVGTPGRWISGTGALAAVLELASGEPRGPSGIAGYAVTLGDREPGTTITHPGERAVADLGELPEGRTRVAARAISGAGVPAGRAGTAELRIDRTPPSVTLRAADLPLRSREGEWLRRDVRLTAEAADQPGLSGMDPAPDGEPLDRGAHLEIQVDDRSPQHVRGAFATIDLDDGDHVVTVRATDAAGNTGPPQRASFRVDRAAPSGAARERSPLAPNVLSAVVAEDCLADATLELRRSVAGARAVTVLARADRRLVTAAVPDDELPAGDYEARFRVRDCAGNVGLVDAGGGARLRLPLRTATVLEAGLGAGAAAARQATRLGRPTAVHGRALTLEGEPLPGRRIELQEQVGTGDWRVRSVLISDDSGRVHARLLAGPSRRLRFIAPSTERAIGARSRVLRLAVPAEATIRASRRSVRNGEAVTFRGRLRGGHVPAGGRELELQGFNPLRGRWQPVRTQGLRADRHGRWRTSYRFTATVGATVTYRFRLRVPPRPDHPFADGHSRSVAVTVRG
jgi:hypothetical protein